ncbi:uncharacterized protein LOC142554765 [Primulina tabacum]|uniref:uncharacterized protein LOC142554765 n=1 Tax=Primulina tabacum TaxID=48773 RepID=UPI003F5AA226
MASRQESDSFSSLILAAAPPPPMVAPNLEEFRDQPCLSRKARRTAHGHRRNCDYYTEEELETADALILLSLSRGGVLVSSSTAAESASDIDSGDTGNNATAHTTTISNDNKNPLLQRIKVSGKEKTRILHKSCVRELSSPQTLRGHETGHRPAAESNSVPDLNVTLRVFECSICHNVYDSGPALGGHKRKHYSLYKASASFHTATNSRCGIDLNLPPVLVNDD